MNKFIFVLLTFLNGIAFSQNWKTLYDEANNIWEQDWNKTIGLLEKALVLAKNNQQQNPTQDTTYTYTLNDLGECYRNINLYEKAEGYFLEMKKVVMPTQYMYAKACYELGYVYHLIGKYTVSETMYLEAKKKDF